MKETEKTKIEDINAKRMKLQILLKECHENGFSGIIFHKDLGHITFYEKETDRSTLIELAKLEDEFIKQKRGFEASQMLKSYIDNIDKIMKDKIKLDNKNKPSYIG